MFSHQADPAHMGHLTSSHPLFAMKVALFACQIYRHTIIYKMLGVSVINAYGGSNHTSYQL